MISILSLVTYIKDYVEVINKFIEYDSININYNELGSILTFFIISVKNSFIDFFRFSWLLKENLSSLPIIVPEISSAMISEISVLDGYFHNTFNFLDTPLNYGIANESNPFIALIEKLIIGIINSLFLFLPTSTAHIITLRRFVMQGLEAGYFAGLGTIVGNVFWLGSVILGLRFFVIPWLSLDIFRYVLGFVLLVKYMWDSYNERRLVSNGESTTRSSKNVWQLSNIKIFLFNFLLALTEQTSIYPFINNISINSETSLLENFSISLQTGTETTGIYFIAIHLAYLTGIAVGSLSLLHLSCWFWENPAFKLYMWVISSFKVPAGSYYKTLNFGFLYLIMLSAVCSIPYYGLDYTVTNPLGYVNDDRLIQDKVVLETSFLGTKASDRNTRRNRGRHGRRERWKRRIRKYRTFDASLYDQGIYDLFTIEDLNYGFDRFWLRRKLRNHRVRFRFFPGPWMRSFKKQLAKPRLESYTGPRIEFFRILYEQLYHPSFHTYKTDLKTLNNSQNITTKNSKTSINDQKDLVLIENSIDNREKGKELRLKLEKSTIRKFLRKLDNRVKKAQINFEFINKSILLENNAVILNNKNFNKFSTYNSKKINSYMNKLPGVFETSTLDVLDEKQNNTTVINNLIKKKNINQQNFFLSKPQLLQYRSFLTQKHSFELNNPLVNNPFSNSDSKTSFQQELTNSNNFNVITNSLTLLHPLKFYMEQETAFKRKLHYYTPNVYRNFSVENNAPFYRVMMKRYFYNYKPNLRWERTLKVASLRKARRKTTRIPRKLQKKDFNSQQKIVNQNNQTQNNVTNQANFIPIENNSIQKSSYNYSVVSKRASRYRYQIYKDVLQHWYYSPFNRLLLKFDVDNFIKRQPNNHFITAEEENLLHLRRFLLFEHYNTLRWYANMQHYRSMKTELNGGTKSFSSRIYNQQFFGTFKKIRHLFAITPSNESNDLNILSNISNKKDLLNTQLDQTNVLKFDQTLYNEFPNSKKQPIVNSLIIHEELLPDYIQDSSKNTNNDLISQSQEIVRKYLIETQSIRSEYIKKLLDENNYAALTQFIFKGQKVRGNEPTTNQKSFNKQEKDYLLTYQERNEIENSIKNRKKERINSAFLFKNELETYLKPSDNYNQKDLLYLTYLKKWKRRVNDQESLKNYLTRRLDKREKRKQKKEKQLLTKIKRLHNWFSLDLIDKTKENKVNWLFDTTSSSDSLTTGLQKSINEGLFVLNKIDSRVISPTVASDRVGEGIGSQLLATVGNSEITPNTINLAATMQGKERFLTKNFLLRKLRNSESLITNQKTSLRFFDIQNVQKKILANHIRGTIKAIRKILLKNTKTIPSDSNNYSNKQNLYYTVKKKLKNYRNYMIRSLLLAPQRVFDLSRITLSKIQLKENFFKPIKRKSLKNWRKKERVLGKMKRSRKEFKLLNKKIEINSNFIDSIVEELKHNVNNSLNDSQLSFKVAERKKRNADFSALSLDNSNKQNNAINDQKNYITNSFKRKRSPQRRSRVRRNRGVFKKRTLSDSLRKDFVLFSKEQNSDVKNNYITKFSKDLYALTNTDNNKQNPLKQRKSKQRKERFWKQKRSKYSQKRRKFRKRRRYTIVKIRNLNKKFKDIQNQLNVQNWWWNEFIPSIQVSNEALWQIERDKLIQQKLLQLSYADILERDNINNTKFNTLQIGNKDFKPLALPESIRLSQLNKQKLNSFNQVSSDLSLNSHLDSLKTELISFENKNRFETLNKLYGSLFINNNQKDSLNRFLLPNTNLPFYAGWDESLRKLIVTNRMLSRKDAGFVVQNDFILNNPYSISNNFNNTEYLPEYNLAPLQGMNAATTLYWQIPFTTYDPDQFFALGMDGFSPIGWRKFLFRHSILKTWLGLRFGDSQKLSNNQLKKGLKTQKRPLIVKSQSTFINNLTNIGTYKKSLTLNLNSNYNIIKKNKAAFSVSRRLKKRYRRVKKHPRTPVWFPSGPLTSQVLPVHYIYVFYKRSRLPRDRYLKRRLLNVKNQNVSFLNDFINNEKQNNELFNYDFTLRKRLKPKRKYHLKRDYYASNVIIPQRFKFISVTDSSINTKNWRPLSLKIHKPISDIVKEQQILRRNTLQKQRSSKQQPNIRVKQLRRRVQRQILRTVWRYRPRAGGFVWPGDYFKLEMVKAPKLQFNSQIIENQEKTLTKISTNSKQKRKKKRNLVEWQIQPKTYLYQKHNINVLKKKLKKAHKSFGNYTNTLNILRNSI